MIFVGNISTLASPVFKTGLAMVESKAGIWSTQLIQSNYLPNQIYQTQNTKPNLLNQICSLGTKLNIHNQIYWTKFAKQTYKTESKNEIYQA